MLVCTELLHVAVQYRDHCIKYIVRSELDLVVHHSRAGI